MRQIVESYEAQSWETRFSICGAFMLQYLEERDIYQPYKRNPRLLKAVKEHVSQNPFPEGTTLYKQLEVIARDLVR